MKADKPPLNEADRNTLELLFAEYRRQLLAFAQQRLDHALVRKADADDILADAFIRAAARLEDLRLWGSANPYLWLRRIVLDCILDAHDRFTTQGRDVRREQPLPEESASRLLGLLSPATTPSNALARRELELRLSETLARLSPSNLAILTKLYFDKLPLREAARALGISENTARVRHFRAVQQLRELWKERDEAEGADA